MPAAEVEPLFARLRELSERIRQVDVELAMEAEEDKVVGPPRSVPSVGLITATIFVAALNQAERFPSAKRARIPGAGAERARLGREAAAGAVLEGRAAWRDGTRFEDREASAAETATSAAA